MWVADDPRFACLAWCWGVQKQNAAKAAVGVCDKVLRSMSNPSVKKVQRWLGGGIPDVEDSTDTDSDWGR